jgi:hypothetical protein
LQRRGWGWSQGIKGLPFSFLHATQLLLLVTTPYLLLLHYYAKKPPYDRILLHNIEGVHNWILALEAPLREMLELDSFWCD